MGTTRVSKQSSKQILLQIADTATAIFKEKLTEGIKNPEMKYDFRVAARAMVDEAFNLGKEVGSGRFLEREEEPAPKKGTGRKGSPAPVE